MKDAQKLFTELIDIKNFVVERLYFSVEFSRENAADPAILRLKVSRSIYLFTLLIVALHIYSMIVS